MPIVLQLQGNPVDGCTCMKVRVGHFGVRTWVKLLQVPERGHLWLRHALPRIFPGTKTWPHLLCVSTLPWVSGTFCTRLCRSEQGLTNHWRECKSVESEWRRTLTDGFLTKEQTVGTKRHRPLLQRISHRQWGSRLELLRRTVCYRRTSTTCHYLCAHSKC